MKIGAPHVYGEANALGWDVVVQVMVVGKVESAINGVNISKGISASAASQRKK